MADGKCEWIDTDPCQKPSCDNWGCECDLTFKCKVCGKNYKTTDGNDAPKDTDCPKKK